MAAPDAYLVNGWRLKGPGRRAVQSAPTGTEEAFRRRVVRPVRRRGRWGAGAVAAVDGDGWTDLFVRTSANVLLQELAGTAMPGDVAARLVDRSGWNAGAFFDADGDGISTLRRPLHRALSTTP
jgi:hypothetical protein